MKLLIDESLQHDLAHILTEAGHDACSAGQDDAPLTGARTLLAVLVLVDEQLSRGAVVTVEQTRLHIRELPIER